MSDNGFEPMVKEDAVTFYAIASDKFGELWALFEQIKALAQVHPMRLDQNMILKLASLGSDVATDYENQSDCWREQLEKGGIKA